MTATVRETLRYCLRSRSSGFAWGHSLRSPCRWNWWKKWETPSLIGSLVLLYCKRKNASILLFIANIWYKFITGKSLTVEYDQPNKGKINKEQQLGGGGIQDNCLSFYNNIFPHSEWAVYQLIRMTMDRQGEKPQSSHDNFWLQNARLYFLMRQDNTPITVNFIANMNIFS